MHSGVLAVTRREIGRVRHDRYAAVLLVILPLLTFAVLVSIFRAGVPRDLPIVVVDQDHTALSRQLTRMTDAAPATRVAGVAPDLEAARARILRNEAYAVLFIPADLERDVRRREAPAVVAYYNSQILLPASLIKRDLRAVTATLSAGLEIKVRELSGEPPQAAMAHVEPIRLDAHTLFNPQLSYVYYLVTALLPTALQIFIMLGTVNTLGVELKEGTAGDWMKAAGNAGWRATAGKLLPYTVYFGLLATLMLAWLFRWLGVPLRGHVGVIVASTVLFVAGYQAVGLLVTAWLANLRLATSATAFYSAPAFAFVGVTFPTIGMPVIGRVWGELLPLTHYVRVLVDQGLRGAPAAVSLPSVAALGVFVLVPTIVSIGRMGRVAADGRYWGRL